MATLFHGFKFLGKIRLLLAALMLLEACATALEVANIETERALPPSAAVFWQHVSEAGNRDWFYLLNSGEEALAWRLAMIDSAHSTIDMETFLWKPDKAGMRVLAPLPEIVGLPAFRADWCDEEYKNAEKAWLWVRQSFIQKSSAAQTEHHLNYGATRDARYQTIRERMVQNEVLEKVLAYVGRSVLLPDAITLRTRSCGSPDAYWDGNTRELILCYQLIEAFYELSEDQGIRELVEQIRTFHRNNPPDANDLG